MPMSSSRPASEQRARVHNLVTGRTTSTDKEQTTTSSILATAGLSHIAQTVAVSATAFSGNGTLSQAAGSERMSLTVTAISHQDKSGRAPPPGYYKALNYPKPGEQQPPPYDDALEVEVSKNNVAVTAADTNSVQPEKSSEPEKGNDLYKNLRNNLRAEAFSTIQRISSFPTAEQGKHRTQGKNLTALHKELSEYNALFNKAINTIKENSPADKVDETIAAFKVDLSIQHGKILRAADELNVKPPEKPGWKEKTGLAMVTIDVISVVAGLVGFLTIAVTPLFVFIVLGPCCLVLGCVLAGIGLGLSNEGEEDRRQLNELYQQYTEIRQNLAPSC